MRTEGIEMFTEDFVKQLIVNMYTQLRFIEKIDKAACRAVVDNVFYNELMSARFKSFQNHEGIQFYSDLDTLYADIDSAIDVLEKTTTSTES